MGKYITFSKNKYINQRSLGTSFSKKQRQKTIGLGFRLGNVSLGFFIIILIGVFGLLYISQINSVAVAGYTIKEVDKKIEELQRKNKEIELELARLQSVTNIKNESQKLNMVELSQASFINPNTAVAIKKETSP